MAWKEARRAGKDEHVADDRRRGRGAVSNATGRFEPERREYFDDGWESLADLEPFKTEVREEVAKTIIATNDSPDIAFDRSINPYRGCEHGCIYCYARPSHAYWGYSAGLDFETKLTAKVNAVEALERELSKPGYSPATLMIGSNTDGYQPIERERKITRGVLEVLDRFSHPVAIVTKSTLVLRDIDILERLASRGLTRVAISVTTLDHRLARKMEPRASTPGKRIEAIRQLSSAGVPVAVMAAPLIPALNDSELGAHPASGSRGGRHRSGLCPSAPAFGNQPPLPGMARSRVSGARQAHHVACALDPGGQGLRPISERHPPYESKTLRKNGL